MVEVRIGGEERWAAVEDVGRLRDGLGTPVPPGTPDVFTEPVDDPLGDLVGRYARTHGPFTTEQVATRLGIGVAVVRHTLQRLAAHGRVLDGEFRPSGSGQEWCDAEVLRRLRRRSLARLRQEVEPVEPEVLGRFVSAWQHVDPSGGRRSLRGVDGVLAVVEQLAGCAVPASALESLVLPARVRDYEPSYLDELTSAGEVIWAGPRHPARLRRLGLAPPRRPGLRSRCRHPRRPTSASCTARCSTPWHPGARGSSASSPTAIGATDDRAVSAALWDLVWAGRVGNDTMAPLRALTRTGTPSHRSRRPPPRARGTRGTGGSRSRLPSRTGPPETAGRWALLPEVDTDPTRRAKAAAEGLLERHGVVVRGAVVSERVPGGFAGVYKVLSAFEESGRCRRGYFVAGLGAAQFGTAGAIDRLRTFTELEPDAKPVAVALAATDPANPYGAGLPWPDRGDGRPPARAARPARWWCWSTVASCCTSSGAGAPCSPGPTTPRCSARRRSRWRRPPAAASSGGSPSSGPTARRCSAAVRRRCGWRWRRPASCRHRRGCGSVPEGDTVWRTARLLDRALAGRTLTRTDFRVPQLATTDLVGGRVLGTESRGKHLLTRIDHAEQGALTLHTHLKMEGAWQAYRRR